VRIVRPYRLLAWLAIPFLAGGCTPPQPADLAIVGVTVVDVTDGSLTPNQTVFVEGTRITLVAPTEETRVSDDTVVVEAAGKYLIPGLWDMHTHSVSKMSVDRTDTSLAAQDWHFRYSCFGFRACSRRNGSTIS